MTTMFKFVATVSDKRGVTLYKSDVHDTREQAMADAFAARPRAKDCSTSKAIEIEPGHWRDTHSDIRFHHRF